MRTIPQFKLADLFSGYAVPSPASRRFVALALLCLSVGCETQLDIDLPKGEWSVVVESYLYPGESARVRVSETVAYFERTPDEMTIGQNAIVTLEHNDTVTLLTDVERYLPDRVFSIAPSGYEYSLPPSLYRVPASGVLALNVQYRGRVVKASATIPPTIRIQSFAVINGPSESSPVSSLDVTAIFPPGRSTCVVNGSFKAQGSYGDPYVGVFVSRTIEVQGTGGPRTVRIPVTNGYIYGTVLRWHVALHNVSEEYYAFLKKIEEQSDSDDNYLGQQGVESVEVEGNISGGRGMFAAITVDTLSMSP